MLCPSSDVPVRSIGRDSVYEALFLDLAYGGRRSFHYGMCARRHHGYTMVDNKRRRDGVGIGRSRRPKGSTPEPQINPFLPNPGAVADSDFQSAPDRRLGGRVVRGGMLVTLGLVLAAGVNQVIVQPVLRAVSDPAPAAVVAASLDPDAAQLLAVSYSADYLGWDPTYPERRDAAVARWTAPGTNPATGWDGDGQVHVGLVQAGAVVEVSSQSVLVQVRAQIIPATLAPGAALPPPVSAASEDPAPASGVDLPVPASDPGPARGPWVPGPAIWVNLAVPVVTTGAGLAVASTGPVLATELPTPLVAPESPEVDTQLTEATEQAGIDLFSAYAEGALTYISAPDTQLQGLDGIVTFAELSGWSIRANPGGDLRYATAEIVWQLAGTELTLSQRYSASLLNSDGRWLARAVSPVLSSEET